PVAAVEGCLQANDEPAPLTLNASVTAVDPVSRARREKGRWNANQGKVRHEPMFGGPHAAGRGADIKTGPIIGGSNRAGWSLDSHVRGKSRRRHHRNQRNPESEPSHEGPPINASNKFQNLIKAAGAKM